MERSVLEAAGGVWGPWCRTRRPPGGEQCPLLAKVPTGPDCHCLTPHFRSIFSKMQSNLFDSDLILYGKSGQAGASSPLPLGTEEAGGLGS